MEILTLSSGWLASNCYLLVSGKEAAVIDPGVDADSILSALQACGATAKFILFTHGHFDHLLSFEKLRETLKIPALIHRLDFYMPEDANKNAFFPLMGREKVFPRPQQSFEDGAKLPLGDETIEVIHTPGHTAGSCCFSCQNGILVTGDTLFDGNVGRTDLYSGNSFDLMTSLKKLGSMGTNPTIYPGHGGSCKLKSAIALALQFFTE